MATMLKFTARGGVCALLMAVAFLATTIGNTFAHVPRAGILDSEETEVIYGAACGTGGGGGYDCKTSLKNVCNTTGGGGVGSTYTTFDVCSVDGGLCKQLGGDSPSQICDTDYTGMNCTATCNGGCYVYYFGPKDMEGHCPDGCPDTGTCGFLKCSAQNQLQ